MNKRKENAISSQQWAGFSVSAVLLALTLALAAPPSFAARGEREAGPAADGQQQIWLRNQRDSGRYVDQREVRGDQSAARAQRLSPEERRQLRRDIRDAGRELYPPRR